MFCDLVGSTPFPGQLDPEELRSLMQAYHVGTGREIFFASIRWSSILKPFLYLNIGCA